MHNEGVNRRNITIAAAVTVIMLVGTTIISITASTTDNAFARKYGRHDATDVSQAASGSSL